MTTFRKIVLISFIGITLAAIVAAFWFFSGGPSLELIQKTFPLDSHEVYTNGKNITLYSLEPSRSSAAHKEDFYGYPVLAKGEIKDEKFVYLLKRSLKNALSSDRGAACFNPRHGLRIADGDKVLDIVICFECSNIEAHYMGKDSSSGIESVIAEAVFNQAIKDLPSANN